VVQSEERGDGFFTALKFILMDDSIRDKILRFVFEKEREILRAKRRE
jgi:c-di-GMP-binding flagellar brake protein YcgR